MSRHSPRQLLVDSFGYVLLKALQKLTKYLMMVVMILAASRVGQLVVEEGEELVRLVHNEQHKVLPCCCY